MIHKYSVVLPKQYTTTATMGPVPSPLLDDLLRSTISATEAELLGMVRGSSLSSLPDTCWLSARIAKNTRIACVCVCVCVYICECVCVNCNSDQHLGLKFTFLALSVSPQGSLRVNSIPVRGVSVGGSSIEASIIRKGTFTLKDCIECGTGEGEGWYFTQ